MSPHPVCTTRLGRAPARLLVALLLAAAPAALPAQAVNAARGVARFEQADYAAARAEFDAILRTDSRNATALYYLGRIAYQEGRSSDAVDLLEKAIESDPAQADYHVWLGAALGEEAQRAGKLKQVRLARRVKTEFERALALDPSNVTARMGLVQYYSLLPGFMGGSMDEARRQAGELSRISPLQGHLAVAFIHMRQRDTAAVEREYNAAIAAAPDSAAGYVALVALYTRLSRWDEAFAAADRLLARRPDEMAAHFQVGRTAALSGQQLDRGERSLRHWLANPPKNAPVVTTAGAHHRLGQILEKKGRRDAARTEYETALRINPKNEDARKSLAALQ